MKQKNEINKIERSAKFKSILLLMLFGMILPGLIATQAGAFEIITEEDIVQKTVMKTDFIKTADKGLRPISHIFERKGERYVE